MRAAVLSLALFLAADAHAAPNLHVPQGFTIETIADIDGARELAALPNSDLIVGTRGQDVYIVPNADGKPGTPHVFAAFDDERASGVAFAAPRHAIYVATMHRVWEIPYRGGRSATQTQRSQTCAADPSRLVLTATSIRPPR